jgi:hypothetical protein
VKAGYKNNKLDFSLILSLARQLPASQNAGLDEREKAGLLASRSSYWLRLTASKMQWLVKRSSLVTAALPRGIYTRFPILPSRGMGHSFTWQHTTYRVAGQRTTLLIDFKRQWSQ